MRESRLGQIVLAALLCVVLFVPCLALVAQLYKHGHYSEALPLAQRALTIREKALGPDQPAVAASLNNLARLYQDQGRYADAEPLYKRSLAIREKTFGPDHPDVATAQNNLAMLYKDQGHYADAEPLYKRSLVILKKAFGLDHPTVAKPLNNLAELYRVQGRYAEAEPLYKQSLAIKEKTFGPDHPDVAVSLNNLAMLYQDQGHYADAEPLYKQSLTIREKNFGRDHPAVATALNNLAELYRTQDRYADAEPLYKRSLAIKEKTFGPDHPDVATVLNNLAMLYQDQGHYADVEPLYKQSLAIQEKALGRDHPAVALALNNLAGLYRIEGRYADAEPLYKQSLAIKEKTFGPDHPDVALALNNLAGLYQAQGRYAEAEPLYKRSLTIREKNFGRDHPDVAASLNNLAGLYQAQGRYADAEPLYKQSLAIQEKALGPDHPAVALALNNLAELYQAQGRYAEAEPLYEQSKAIKEKTFGPDHPDVALALNNLAGLYQAQGRYAEAEPLYKRSLAIAETYGPVAHDHPDFAALLNNLAGLYQAQGRYADAEPLYKQSLAIQEKALGPDHPAVALALNNLAELYRVQGRYAEAEPLYEQSFAIREKALGPDHPAVAASLNNLARLYQDQGRYADALPILKRVMSHNLAHKSIALPVLYGSESRNLIPPNEVLDASYTVLQRSVSSAAGEAISKLGVRFAAGTSERAQLVRKDQDLTAEIDRLDKRIVEVVLKPPVERNSLAENEIRKRMDEKRSERAKLEEDLTKRHPDYIALSKPQPLTIEQTQALLADDEALVAVDLDQKSYVWVITKDRAQWKALSVSAQDVSKEVETLRTGLDAPKPFDRDLAYQLYRQLLEPIEGIITQKKRLSFVFDGALTSLPPQVLLTSDPGNRDLVSLDWLIRKYAVTVLPSVASLKVLRGQQFVVAAPKPMIGFGDPVFDRTVQKTGRPKAGLNRSLPSFYRGAIVDMMALGKALDPLHETADELREVARLLGAKSEDIKLGEDATVTAVKHERLYDYRVVYFATHALVAGDIEKFTRAKAEPALVLSIPVTPSEEDNGLLTASEVATLKLNADFVVLSACNTAGDEPGAEALSGLARAFFYAGARSLVVSHWEVDSEATVTLMDGLFKALKANPDLSHAEALRWSMLQMISKPEWVQPRFWAPFVIVGEPKK